MTTPTSPEVPRQHPGTPQLATHHENQTATPLTPEVAAVLLADLGFLIVPNVLERDIEGFLLVAIRDHPTLRHYDPEEVDYWIDAGLHGAPVTLWSGTQTPLHDAFSWGVIRLVDRLRVTNDFLTFGGTLRAERIEGTTVAVFRSMAPMVQLGGHSQVADPLAIPLAAFLGRLRGAMTVSPAVERQVIAAAPLTRYAACISDGATRFEHAPLLQDLHPEAWHLFQTERARFLVDHVATWAAGEALAELIQPVVPPGHRDLPL